MLTYSLRPLCRGSPLRVLLGEGLLPPEGGEGHLVHRQHVRGAVGAAGAGHQGAHHQQVQQHGAGDGAAHHMSAARRSARPPRTDRRREAAPTPVTPTHHRHTTLHFLVTRLMFIENNSLTPRQVEVFWKFTYFCDA